MNGPTARVPMASIAFTVNARSVEVMADGDTPLLDVLRNHLGLTGRVSVAASSSAGRAWC